MTKWLFENVYHYADGVVYVVTLQHIVTDDKLVETLEIRRVRI